MSLPNPFPLNISEKQDTFEKKQLMENVPDAFKYMAADFNKFLAGLNWMYENLPATAGTAVEKRYATIAAMLADQAGQSTGKFMFVTDATADTEVASGYAYYEKLEASTGELTNYKRLSINSVDFLKNNDIYLDSIISEKEQTITALVNSKIADYDKSPITLTEQEFEDLLIYENRYYFVIGVGKYFGATLIEREEWVYDVNDLHVSKSGNDGTGDGSFANPYLTIDHAFDQVASTGGVKIWVQEGTYAEDSGNGYFSQDNAAFDDPVYIQARPGDRVILTAASSTYVIRMGGVSNNIYFKGLEIHSIATTTWMFRIAAATHKLNNGGFIECSFIDSIGVTYATFGSTSAGNESENFQIKRCYFQSSTFNIYLIGYNNGKFIGNRILKTGTNGAVELRGPQVGTFSFNSNSIDIPNQTATTYAINQSVAIDSSGAILDFKNNAIRCADRGVRLIGGTLTNPVSVNMIKNKIYSSGRSVEYINYIDGGVFEKNEVETDSSDFTCAIPSDTATGDFSLKNYIIKNNLITAPADGLPLLVSRVSDNITVQDSILDGTLGRAGIAIKGENHLIKGNLIYCGNVNGFYIKGQDGTMIKENLIIQKSGGNALRYENTEEEVDNTSILNNIFFVETGSLMEDSGGNNVGLNNIQNHNKYLIKDSWGSLFGVAIISLQHLREVWAANYTEDNDSKSVEITEL